MTLRAVTDDQIGARLHAVKTVLGGRNIRFDMRGGDATHVHGQGRTDKGILDLLIGEFH